MISLTALIFLAPLATAVEAYPLKDPPATELVSYADLHLASMQDRKRLEWRVRASASRLCTEDTNALPTAYVDSGCYRAAMADARRQMDRAIAQASGGPALVLARAGSPR